MTYGIIEHISYKDNTATIALETGRVMQVELDMLPENVGLDDFVILEKGLFKLDPENSVKKEQLKKQLNDLIAKGPIE